MSSPKYMMVTVATCAQQFMGTALGHLGTLCGELKSQAGAVTTRYGVIATGEHTGQLILFQTYDSMGGFEKVFDVYGASAAYKDLVGHDSVSVTLRNMLKIEDLGLENASDAVPAFGVVTRWGCPDLMLDDMRAEVPHFENNGATVLRYSTILTGPAAGRRLLTVGYPSMDAIEKTYEALRASAGYQKLMGTFDIDWRNIIRVAG